MLFPEVNSLEAFFRRALRCSCMDRGRWLVIFFRNCLALGASFKIIFLSFILTNLTTVAGACEEVELEGYNADLCFGSRWTMANDIFTKSDSEYRKEMVRNERITCSLCSGVSSGDSKGRPWKRRLYSFDRNAETISDFLVFSRISVNSFSTPLRSDVRSEIVLYACSKLVSASCKRSIRDFSIAERRSESLFSTDCSNLYRSDNCRASFPSGAWPALCFRRVIALFFSTLVLVLIYLNHWQSIFVCTRLKIQLREYQRQIQQNSTKPQRKKLIKFRRNRFPSSWTTAVWKTRPFSLKVSDWIDASLRSIHKKKSSDSPIS